MFCFPEVSGLGIRAVRIQISEENMDLNFNKIISSKRFIKISKKLKKLPFKVIKYEVQFGGMYNE